MKIRSKFLSLIFLCLLVAFPVYRAYVDAQNPVSMDEETAVEEAEDESQDVPEEETDENPMDMLASTSEKDTIHLWYSDEALTEYLLSEAMAYMNQHENVRVVPTCISAVEYLESIYDATIEDEVYPDLFIISNDCLERAYLSGLATEIADSGKFVTADNMPQVALDAVTYKNQLVAYPMYFDTSLFLYNQTHLNEMVSMNSISENSIMPHTMEDILNLADEYDAPEGVEGILKWDVSDIFFNYFFAGNYIDIGGKTGDDSSILSISNQDTKECLDVYQSLNQFFSIEAKQADYASVLEEFMQGKIMFTFATMEAIRTLENAKTEGTFQGEYGITLLPDVSAEKKSKGLSVTNAIAVNGYGKHKELANDFAAYLTSMEDQDLYQRAGKISVNKNIVYDNDNLNQAMAAYEISASLPKVIQASNFWVQLEAALTDIWQGRSTQDALDELQTQMQQQMQE